MIVISGGNGFIGRNLVKSIPNSISVSLREKYWKNHFSTATAIINLVGKAHDHSGTATKEDFYYANLELTKDVFNAFVESNANILIHISSIAAVEEFESLKPLTEENNCHPVTFYGESKRAGEKWLLDQDLPENKKLIILRPPMVHGPGDKGNLGILYKFISKGLPNPFANLDNSRSFISINNFTFYIDQILNNFPDLNNGIYHVADNESVSTKEIIDIIEKVTNKKSLKISLPNSVVKLLANLGDIIPIPINNKRLKKLTSTLLVSNSKINTSLNIQSLPESGRDGIYRTVFWFKSDNLHK
ncbi:NAD-dependent epimerase/dehydratase family protein [Sphingobacterium daejeonense]|uniref:NAD-dependent epimerase/dehydratase family protein n=1 Tax=Sphingobacterium daejeonense TaxID=371142 RepID=UPI0021A84D22|nr:NAD-dependent epimerase/dehydratase family protein [Sphingobacterium daejeonense]MCT1532634.1 NAD-dependent epimerase/dehydratase family protein [Sphingobacterium daejeonense]